MRFRQTEPALRHSESADGSLRGPSSLYRAELWQLGLRVARALPPRLGNRFGEFAASAYCAFNPGRCGVVVKNLLPLAGGDFTRAEMLMRELFQQFALKLADLWRYEAGLPVEHLIQKWTGWEHFTAAQKQGRGILLVTPHLGNWEFGAPLLASQGIKLTVITQAEPSADLTNLRQASRSSHGIETIVIGTNPFAFVDIIRRLERGATIALLIDRPPAATAVPVELFGRPFLASIAAAELARASGCAILPVYLPRHPEGYSAHVLPEIPYDRQCLGKREMRRIFTQELIKTFEPVIQQNATQWYHFVPIWPEH